MYSQEDVLTFVEEENVKFIKLAFFDVFGVQKNISILPQELPRAFDEGISFDASAIAGFGNEGKSDLFLHPDPSTLCILPWRPMDGRVIRLYCDVRYPDGSIFQDDSRWILKQAVAYAQKNDIEINLGAEVEFYLFQRDEENKDLRIPFDQAGYMDVAPKDQGEDIRREICFTLIEMGIQPEASHHEEGPGQNEIDFHYSDALTAADHTSTFKWVVEMVASGNGLEADFSPKPLADHAGNGMHINLSLPKNPELQEAFLAGILDHICEMTVFFNPHKDSFLRLGEKKAPRFVSWSKENRSTLIRIPAVKGGQQRIELRSPDPMANPYLCYALLIYAGIDGIQKHRKAPQAIDVNLYTAQRSVTDLLQKLPTTHAEAWNRAAASDFIKQFIPAAYLHAYR
ncbi:glutamine synthetase family protein [Merdibacter massiliensis]|uniref:glutamine synthetase family protein n=1 Tax=Merdibacter massiliensis TaxID=1871030 RepID=UPI00096A7E09|nr:glutamine synthetase family protein [Merdibacter massiliensis]